MLLGLGKIIDCPGASVDFSVSIDLSDLLYGKSHPVSEPVMASGTVRNTAGVLVMKGGIHTTIHGVCDRCAADFTAPVEIPIDVVLVREFANEENEDDRVFDLKGESADLEEIVRTTFVLNMDSQLLCKPDCKGVCGGCGRNLNQESCVCQKEIDPRLAALQQLLNK